VDEKGGEVVLRRRAAIVGVYETEQARSLDRSPASLQIESLKGALDDAGLTLADVDGVVPHSSFDPANYPWPGQFWAAQLGGRVLTYFDEMTGGNPALQRSALAVSAGLADVVVHVFGKSKGKVGPAGQPVPDRAPRMNPWSVYTTGGSWPMWYAMWARRYMHEFGVTNEDLAHVGVLHRYHATLNPHSLMGGRGEITVDDVVSSRMIAEPLHLLDCALDNDGGWAIVVASEDIARNCRKKPVWISGGAEGTETDLYMTIDPPWIRESGSAVRRVGEIALAQAGVTVGDLDVANLYDCFSITMLRNLEELGFCKLGEAADYFKEGNTRVGGSMPCNTDGGLLSHSHCGAPQGFQAIEVARQLRGECDQRQVAGARTGLAFSQGAGVHALCAAVVLTTD
jgi:acetyl-CoA C-acetyltransferase